MTLGVAHIITYFSHTLHNYLYFFRCIDDFYYVKIRLFWYFRMSLVSTLKTKYKLNGKNKAFKKYSPALKCFDTKGNIIQFVKWKNIKNLKKKFVIHKPLENLNQL
jgi:hypothetical protein